MKTLWDWFATMPPGVMALIGSLVGSGVAVVAMLVTARQRSRELRDALTRHGEQLTHSLLVHREKLDADATAQKTSLEHAFNLHREKIKAELRKDDVSRKMELRREIFVEGTTSLAKVSLWVQYLADSQNEADFKAPVIQEFVAAMAKLAVVGSQRTVEASFLILDGWRGLMFAAIQKRFGDDPDNLIESARRKFADASVNLNLALRAELDLPIDEEWFRATVFKTYDTQDALVKEWLQKVQERTC